MESRNHSSHGAALALTGLLAVATPSTQAQASPVPYIQSVELVWSCNYQILNTLALCTDATFESVWPDGNPYQWTLPGSWTAATSDFGAQKITVVQDNTSYTLDITGEDPSDPGRLFSFNPGTGVLLPYIGYRDSSLINFLSYSPDNTQFPPFQLNAVPAVAAIPEPSTLALGLAWITALGASIRRRTRTIVPGTNGTQTYERDSNTLNI